MTHQERDALILLHLPLVKRLLRFRFSSLPSYIDRGELEGIGNLALVRAAGDFNPEEGVEFAAVGWARVKWAILDHLRSYHNRRRKVIWCELPESYDTPSPNPSQEEIFTTRQLKKWIKGRVQCFPERDRAVFRRYFGREPATIAAIGKELGLTSNHVRQIIYRRVQELKGRQSSRRLMKRRRRSA